MSAFIGSEVRFYMDCPVFIKRDISGDHMYVYSYKITLSRALTIEHLCARVVDIIVSCEHRESSKRNTYPWNASPVINNSSDHAEYVLAYLLLCKSCDWKSNKTGTFQIVVKTTASKHIGTLSSDGNIWSINNAWTDTS